MFSLQATDDLEALYDLMDQHHVRHVPVVDRDGDLVGLVTQRDLARSVLGAQDLLPLSVQQEILRRRSVREIMATEVETVEPDEDLRNAAEMLIENKIGCLPVVEGEHLVGILTESDFVRRYVREEVDMHANLGRFLGSSAAVLAGGAFASAGVESMAGFHRVSNRVAIGTQPTPDEVTAWAAEGFNGIVNLREEAEFNDGPQSDRCRR